MRLYLPLVAFLTFFSLTSAKAQSDTLFSFMNYNPRIIAKALTLDSTELTLIERTVLRTYLSHPELITRTVKDKIHNTPNDSVLAPDIDDVTLSPVVAIINTKGNPDKLSSEAIGPIPGENVEMVVTKPKFWTVKGDYFLQFMQNYVSSNWYKGGSSSYSMMGNTTMEFNFDNKKKVKWDNKVELRLGFQTNASDTVNKFKTSEDLIRLTSKFGIQAHKQWYYTLQLIASTQFTKGLKDNDRKVYSDFLSPLTMNVSLGMDYTIKSKNDVITGTLHFAPIAFDMKYVDRRALVTSYGIEEGKHCRTDFGSGITATIEWKPIDFFKWKSYMYLYTSYHRFEFQWENTLTMQFNKFLSTNIYLYPRFDDNAKRVDNMSYWQFKEYLSVGFSYSL